LLRVTLTVDFCSQNYNIIHYCARRYITFCDISTSESMTVCDRVQRFML